MAYDHSLALEESVNQAEGTTSAKAAINRLQVAEPEIRFPGGGTIEEFGVTVRTTYSASANRPIFYLQAAPAASGSFSDVASLTVPASAAAGARLKSSASAFPYRVKPGGAVRFAYEVTSGTDTGDGSAYIIARMDGFGGPNTAAPVTEVAS